MRRAARTFALGVVATIAVVAMARATVAGDWEVEIHGGGLLPFSPSSGRATSPPRGDRFETVVPGLSSVRVSSWYYGSGGRLIAREETYIYSYVGTRVVQPLDPILSSAAIRWPTRGGAGVRVGRRLGRRLSAELAVEYGGHVPEFSEAARAHFEESRLDFETAWSRTVSALPGSQVTSEATIRDGTGHQLVATGVININLRTNDPPKWSRRPARRRFVTYLTLGAGIVSASGEEARATLVGRYRFASPAGASEGSYQETDTVTVRSSESFGTSIIGVVGLGWKKDLSRRWGVRVDARGYLGRNPTRVVLDARPSVTTSSPASALVVDSTIGAIQFVNDSAGTASGQRSSLSGPPLEGFETFRGTGLLWQINLTFGAYLRF
jgi:hypothetical protein